MAQGACITFGLHYVNIGSLQVIVFFFFFFLTSWLRKLNDSTKFNRHRKG